MSRSAIQHQLCDTVSIYHCLDSSTTGATKVKFSLLWRFCTFLTVIIQRSLSSGPKCYHSSCATISYRSLIFHWGSNKLSLQTVVESAICAVWNYTQSSRPCFLPFYYSHLHKSTQYHQKLVTGNFVQELPVSLGPAVFSVAMQFSESKTTEDLPSSASGWVFALPLYLSSTFPKSPTEAFN